MFDYSLNFEPEVYYLLKKNGKKLNGWDSWKKVNDCSEEELEQSNIIKIGYTECVLDIDHQDKLDPCVKRLNGDGLSYEVWNSGSEGHYHIYLEFEELKWLKPEVNEKLKETLIKRYLPDDKQALAKASNRTAIAQKNKPHFKIENNGRLKSLIKKENRGINILSSEILLSFVNSLVDTHPCWQRVDNVEIVENEDTKDFKEVVELLRSVPKVFENFEALNDDAIPIDRSGKDWVITKFLAEKRVNKELIHDFLYKTKWSKVKVSGKNYFDFTYKNALRKIQEWRFKNES